MFYFKIPIAPCWKHTSSRL